MRTIPSFIAAFALLGLAGATPPAQDDVRVVPAPRGAPTEREVPEPAVAAAQRVADVGEGVLESMDAVLLRDALWDPASQPGLRMREGRRGEWRIPGRREVQSPRSGTRYAYNGWGDTRMGIGFPGPVELAGAWVARAGGPGAAARALRVVGFRDGAEVARTEWFRDLGPTPRFFAMRLSGVDRIEIEAEEAVPGSGWYGLDDLTFTDSAGREVVVDFEGAEHGEVLSGSGYAGLRWELGTGAVATTAAGAGTSGAPAPPPGPKGAGAKGAGGLAAAAGNGTLPELYGDFAGVKMFDAGASAIPPDTGGAVGLEHVVGVANSNLSVFEKASGQRVLSVSLGSFFAASFPADPRVVFDPDALRFVVTATNFDDRIHLAVSATSDPLGPWFKSFWNPAEGADAGKWPDYPTLGVDRRWILCGAYMVGGQDEMTLFVVEKAPLLKAPPAMGTVHAFRQLTFEGAIQPAVHWTDAGEAYAVSVKGPDRIRVRTVRPPVSAPTMTSSLLTVSADFKAPPSVPALGSTTKIDTVGGRLMNAVFRDGSLWTTHAIEAGGRAACRWYEIDPAAPAELQLGTVRDLTGAGLHYFFPSIAASAEGHAVLGGSVAGAQQWVGAFFTGRLATDPPGEMAVPFEYKAGEGPYNRLDGDGRNRWGDYSATGADPVDGTLWTFQEYARANNRWGTHVARLGFGGGCEVDRSCSPSALGPRIDVQGCSLSASAIPLTYSGGTPGLPGYLLVGRGSAVLSNPPGARGDLCLGGAPIGRYVADVAVVDSGGRMTTDVLGGKVGGGNATLPATLGAGAIQPGDTWTFQYWARHAGVPSTFSDAIAVTFTN